MNLRRSVISLGLVLGLCVIAASQQTEKSVKLEDLPDGVRKTVTEQSKGAKLRGLSQETKDGKTYYEAELMVDGRTRDVLMDSSGGIVEIEEEVPWKSLPSAVRSALKKQAGQGKIIRIESITRAGQVVAYEAHVKTGDKWSEIKVEPDGKPMPEDEDKDKD